MTQVKDGIPAEGKLAQKTQVMSKTTKLLFALAIIALILGLAFNVGVVNNFNLDLVYTVLPLGAVSFGLFLIAKVLEKETQAYDEEQKANTHAKH